MSDTERLKDQLKSLRLTGMLHHLDTTLEQATAKNLDVISTLNLLADIGHVGIIFLLFLLGLDMQPQALWSTLRKSFSCLVSLRFRNGLLHRVSRSQMGSH